MKKIILSGIIAAAVITTSCRKERTCDCRTTETTVRTGFGPVTEVATSEYKVTMEKQKKGEFKLTTNCVSSTETRTESYGSGNNGYTDFITTETTCDLK